MSFSSDVKEELKTQVSPARHCCIAEFAALFALAGQVKRFSKWKRLYENTYRKLDSGSKILYLIKENISC